MTTQEHELLILMFARQRLAWRAVVELLQARGVAEGDDLTAFFASVCSNPQRHEALLRETREEYLEAARMFQVPVGEGTP